MRFLGVSVEKDLRRLWRDPLALVMALGLPLVIGLLISLVFGGDSSGPSGRLLVADQDSTIVSRLLTGAFGQGDLADIVTTQPVTEEKGREAMDAGKASGLLIIPEGFGDDVLRRRPATITLITNPSQIILPGILEEVLVVMTDGLSSAQNLLGPLLDPMVDGPRGGAATFPDSQIVSTSLAVNAIMRHAGPLLFPPVIKVQTVITEAKKDEPERGFADYFFPSMFFMAVMFLAQGRSDDFWQEREAGTLRRSLTTPGRLSTMLLGKTVTGGLAILAVSLLGLLAARWLFGLHVSGFLLAAFWGALAGTVMLLFFTLLQNLAATQRGGNIRTNMVVFPLIMLGGSFFPFEAMPEWLARIGKLTPNGWALVRFKEILWGTATPSGLAVGALGLLVGGALLFALNLARLRAIARS